MNSNGEQRNMSPGEASGITLSDCPRCRNHGSSVRERNHAPLCPFKECSCSRCYYITNPRQYMTLLLRVRRMQEEEKRRRRSRISPYTIHQYPSPFLQSQLSRTPASYRTEPPSYYSLIAANVGALLRKERENKSVQTVSYWEIDLSPGSLSEDFSELLDKGSSHHDVVFYCEVQLIRAHKILLSARSEVLRAMLHSDMREGLTGVVDIRDMNLSDLKDFVRYLYTDKLPDRLTSEKATVLYEAGDRYDVKSLMHRCSEYLLDSVRPESFPRLLALAAAHSDQKMMIGLVHQQMKNGGLHLFDMSTIQILYTHFPYLTADNKTVLRSLFSEPVPKRVQTELNWNVDQSDGSLSRDLSNLLSSGANCDVTLNCGGQSIRAHKIVLGARSERLKAMLQQQDDSATAQRGSGPLEIGDIDSGDFHDFVRYLYTDELPVLTFAKAKSLYEAGEKYGVRNLMRRCSNLKIS